MLAHGSRHRVLWLCSAAESLFALAALLNVLVQVTAALIGQMPLVLVVLMVHE